MQRYKKVFGLILFLFITAEVLLASTYLFRSHPFGFGNRINVVGLKEEPKDSLDMIYIGGSAAVAYWSPFEAYNDCGFTSYDLATDTIQAESILAYMKYAQKYQNPDLYVVGVRSFQYYSDEGDEIGLRNSSDSLDVGINRFDLVRRFLKDHKLETDKLSLYLDLIKYHTNYEMLSNEIAWSLIDNSAKSDNKGGGIQKQWCYLETPEDFQNSDRAEINPNDKAVVEELLDYCDRNRLNVFFVVCPYYITEEDYSVYNTIGDMITARGYGFLNTNDHFEDMDIDFATDFSNRNHVNAKGAEKYTAFLEKYLVENYSLPDHRGERDYDEWDKAGYAFRDFSDEAKSYIDDMIADADRAVEQGAQIRETDDFGKWCMYVRDYRYSLLATGNGEMLKGSRTTDEKALEYLGVDLDDLYSSNRYINVFIDEMHELPEPEADGNTLKGDIGRSQYKCDFVIDDSGDRGSIKISDKEYSLKDQQGLNMVVFDNYYRTIIDSVTLKKENGAIVLKR